MGSSKTGTGGSGYNAYVIYNLHVFSSQHYSRALTFVLRVPIVRAENYRYFAVNSQSANRVENLVKVD